MVASSSQGFLRKVAFSIPGVRFLTCAIREARRPAPYNEFESYDEYWERRDSDGFRNLPHVLKRYEYVTQRIPNGARVLDVGCGDGGFLTYLKEKRPDCTLLGADIATRSIELLAQKNIEGVVIDPSRKLAEQIGGMFDYVVLMEVIEHVVDAESLIRQVCEFQPKRIFVSIPNMGYILNRFRLMFGGRTPITVIVYHMREHVRFWTVKDFRQWAKALGLQVKHVAGQFGYSRELTEFFPSLFAQGVIYELEINKE